MYKLLIIDDDEMIRNGIKNAIAWHEYEVTEVMTAENGEKGWMVFESFLPDIVLTDIRMPGKDGLELLKDIKKAGSDSKVIILSGYDDFCYAQTALKSGAFDYLLKTADIDELLEVVKRAINEINNDRNEHEVYLKLKEQLSMSLPLLKFRCLNELVFGYTDITALEKKMEFADLRFPSGKFLVAVGEIDDISTVDDKATEEERQILKLRIIKAIEDAVAEEGVCFETKLEEFVLVFFCCDKASNQENKYRLIKICEDISCRLAKNINLKFSFGISNAGNGLASIKLCYEEAKKALEHKLFTGQGSVIDIKDIESFTPESFKLDSEVENKLVSALRVGDKNTVLKIVDDVFDRMRLKRNMGIGTFHKVCIEMLGIASRVLCEFDAGMEEVFGKEFLYFDEVKKYKNIDSAKEWMYKNFEKLVQYILNTKILKAKKIVETAKSYIDEHYHQELSLNQIAELVYMSPNYFSSLFSNEAGQSFLEYVTAKRLEKAKQLLGDKDSKAFEVGEKVGYDNPNYFSRIFKKYTGMSPSEYKESLKTR